MDGLRSLLRIVSRSDVLRHLLALHVTRPGWRGPLAWGGRGDGKRDGRCVMCERKIAAAGGVRVYMGAWVSSVVVCVSTVMAHH